jgi:hypothetical protein
VASAGGVIGAPTYRVGVEYLLAANGEPRDILRAGPNVEFENTNYLGLGKKYLRMPVPFGGYVSPAFDLSAWKA